ncbi:MAG: protease modulator HflC [Candidatus Nealsonbacteria bacterium]|nr:protease modulator HflC [Candidatus Nealsonbacteria bacterium]
MKRQIVPLVLLALVTVAAVVLWTATYVVEEGKQVVVTQFGKVVNVETEANLYFKIPLVQEVHVLEKRLLPWDGAPESMQTRDKKRIFIDVWARWKIVDLSTFFKAVRTEQGGQKILDDLVDSAVRDVVARNKLIDVVRSSDEQLVYESEELARTAEGAREQVTTGRAEMEKQILAVAGKGLKDRYGIELFDVHIKRVNYVESVKETVYERMRSERQRVARLFESQAQEEKNRILGLTRKDLDLIEGEMEQKSAEIKGKADAEVIQMTAAAYGKSPEAIKFYEFLRRLEVFKTSLEGNSRLVLSTDSDVFQLLKKLEPSE